MRLIVGDFELNFGDAIVGKDVQVSRKKGVHLSTNGELFNTSERTVI
jgi:hypothetical protein